MATVPTSHTFTGGVAASSEMNTYVRDPIDFLMNKPAARLRQTVAQTLANATFTPITFTTEDLDDDPAGTGGHDNAVNTSRYTAVYAGWYRVSGTVSYVANTTGVRATQWLANGSAVNGGTTLVSTSSASTARIVARTMLVFLNVGDYVQLAGYQTSGGNLDTTVGADEQSTMDVVWERLA